MSKQKLLRVGSIVLTLALILVVIGGAVYAGNLATFDNPTVTACSLAGITISGRLYIGDRVYVEEYLNGVHRTSFNGAAGTYSGYVSRFSTDSYSYEWKAILSFKNSSGELVEQYELEATCTALDTGTATFREVELSPVNSFSLS